MPSEAEYREQAVFDQRMAERKELKALRAEVQRLQASNLASEIARANQRNDELLAENERLKKEVEQVELINFRRVEENERLRKALRMIRNAVDITRDQVAEGWIVSVADDALSQS